MEPLKIITALAAEAGRNATDRYWSGILDGVELVIDKVAQEGELTPEWIADVRDFLAVAREHAS